MSDSLRALAERAAREILPSSCWHSEMANERRKRMIDAIERVARQVVEDERAACAAVADTHYIGSSMTGDYRYCCPVDEKIRARGDKT